MKSLVLLACLLSSLAWSAGIKKKDLSTTEYFRLFDYKNHSLTKEIFDFEKKLIEQAYLVEAYLQKNPTYKAPKKKYSSHVKLAMNLVYASMMILNNNNAVQENHVSLKDLTQATVLTDGSNLRQEMIARYNLSQRFLELAVKTAPDDERIPAWHAANVLRRQHYVEGKVSEEVMDFITDFAVKSPIFHLFNALTMASDYDFGEARLQKLLGVVDFLNSKESPCAQLIFRRGEAKKCNTTSKTPFSFQGVTTYMGDAYLRASVHKHQKDPAESKRLAEKANALYTRVDWLIFKPKAKKWRMLGLLEERKDYAFGLMNGENKTAEFFETREYLDIYTCTSCHQDGRGKGELHLNLP